MDEVELRLGKLEVMVDIAVNVSKISKDGSKKGKLTGEGANSQLGEVEVITHRLSVRVG